jgi:hypothetical protein
MKPSDVNKVDPKYTSLDDYKTALAFLKIPEMDIYDDETNKQRYICGYDVYIFMKGSLIPLSLSILTCIFIFYIANTYPAYFQNNSILSYMWPWNASLSERLNSIGRGAEANIVCSITGIVSTIWLVWISVQVITEIKIQGSFYIPRIIYVSVPLSVLIWLGASVDVIAAPSFGPTLGDTYTILSIKKVAFISFSYWTSGYSILSTAPYLRSLLKRAAAKLKRSTS